MSSFGRVVVALVCMSFAMGARPEPVEGQVRRAFDLVRDDGTRVTDKSFHGTPLLVFFGFATCPDVCPTGLAVISKAVRELERGGVPVTPLFITVDPDRDTPQLLHQYVKQFHPRMVGLTGSQRDIANAAAAYGVDFGVQKNAGAYYVWHSSSTYLVGPRGELLETFPPYTNAETIVKDARAKLAKSANAAR